MKYDREVEKMRKKLLSLALALCMAFGGAAALPQGSLIQSTSIIASAASSANLGKCGKNVRWTLKNGVLTISGKGAMYDQEVLDLSSGKSKQVKKIIIKKGVTSIGANAFYGYKNLSGVTIPNSVKRIGLYAFAECGKIKSITIPSGVKRIEQGLFVECKNLESVKMPSGITSIGAWAFAGCSKLKNITIPKKVSGVGAYAFSSCYGLKSVVFPKGVKTISPWSFSDCRNLSSVSIPNSVTSIGIDAFTNTKLSNVVIPKSVSSIDERAFGYYTDEKTQKIKKDTSFLINCYKGSKAEIYAKQNGFQYCIIPSVKRLYGSDRYGTAVKISKTLKKSTSQYVLLADGYSFNDALVSVPLASAYNAPMLLTLKGKLPAATQKELNRLKPKTVIVVSTKNAISNTTIKNLKKKYKVSVIKGGSCYETARKVAKALQSKVKTNTKKKVTAPKSIFFVVDNKYADALSISPVAAALGSPIIYVSKSGKLNANISTYLRSVKGKVKNAYIIGGTAAISKSTEKKIKSVLGSKTKMIRVAGANRYSTCVKINRKFKKTLSKNAVCVARGYNYPDALAGGVFAARYKAPLFLADNGLNSVQIRYLNDKNADRLYVFGGPKAISNSTVSKVKKASSLTASQVSSLMYASYASVIEDFRRQYNKISHFYYYTVCDYDHDGVQELIVQNYLGNARTSNAKVYRYDLYTNTSKQVAAGDIAGWIVYSSEYNSLISGFVRDAGFNYDCPQYSVGLIKIRKGRIEKTKFIAGGALQYDSDYQTFDSYFKNAGESRLVGKDDAVVTAAQVKANAQKNAKS